MNKQELIESIAHLPSDCSRPRPMIDKITALELIKLLDEPQKVTVMMKNEKMPKIDDFVFALQVGKLVVDTAKAIIVDDNLLGSNGKFVLDSHTFNITVSEEK